MSAEIIPFSTVSQASEASTAAANDSPEQLQAAIDRLEQLDHDLQVQAHRIYLSLGEVRRERLLLMKRIASLRSA